jgi:hypothetical protein
MIATARANSYTVSQKLGKRSGIRSTPVSEIALRESFAVRISSVEAQEFFQAGAVRRLEAHL